MKAFARIAFLFALGLLAGGVLEAQTVSTEASACGIHYLGTTYACTQEVESVSLINFGANKASVISAGADELLVPGQFSVYGADVAYQPDLSSLLSKTNLPVDQFSFAVDVMGGVATLPAGNAASWEARGKVGYAFSPNVALTTAYAGGGMIGQHGFWIISAGIEAILNPSASPSALVKHLIGKSQAAKAAKVNYEKANPLK